ncbi:hypothetical protein LOAG_03836 [Loa loa]|uniref:Uncharacterized protein n=1 Tax=Loa loa TaxID=7209 RepID=A0A1S0U3T2_LOALO|nr:hypothetical protein LOAG_03836 [Loa loa]EFO24649.1 hypothetical protein LOAG_03836 [Loa loa]
MEYVASQFGYFISTYPLLTIGSTLMLSFSIITAFIFNPIIIETDIRHGFVNRNSRSVLEFQRFAEFNNASWKDMEMMAVLIQPKYLNETVLQITPQLCDEVNIISR